MLLVLFVILILVLALTLTLLVNPLAVLVGGSYSISIEMKIQQCFELHNVTPWVQTKSWANKVLYSVNNNYIQPSTEKDTKCG